MTVHDSVFIPGTREIEIYKNIVYRPQKSWHSGVYAGEKIKKLPDSDDRSGCIRDDGLCHPPLSYTHRLYWNIRDPGESVSACLSYPNAIGFWGNGYFWEILFSEAKAEDFERFMQESHMEKRIIEILKD